MKTYTREEAEQLGYRVIKASAFEVGLVKGDKGVKTWWNQDFDRKLPDLGHPKILEAVAANENLLGVFAKHEVHVVMSAVYPAIREALEKGLEGWAAPRDVNRMTAEYKNLVDKR
jgi:hypothetical protein